MARAEMTTDGGLIVLDDDEHCTTFDRAATDRMRDALRSQTVWILRAINEDAFDGEIDETLSPGHPYSSLAAAEEIALEIARDSIVHIGTESYDGEALDPADIDWRSWHEWRDGLRTRDGRCETTGDLFSISEIELLP